MHSWKPRGDQLGAILDPCSLCDTQTSSTAPQTLPWRSLFPRHWKEQGCWGQPCPWGSLGEVSPAGEGPQEQPGGCTMCLPDVQEGRGAGSGSPAEPGGVCAEGAVQGEREREEIPAWGREKPSRVDSRSRLHMSGSGGAGSCEGWGSLGCMEEAEQPHTLGQPGMLLPASL